MRADRAPTWPALFVLAAALFVLAVAGCRGWGGNFHAGAASECPAIASGGEPPVVHRPELAQATATPIEPVAASRIAAAAHQEPLPPLEGVRLEAAATDEPLTRQWLVAEVEALNPSLAAMFAAWEAAAQRYPQRIALDDPMLMGMLAPGSDTAVTETAYAFQLNQKLPWPGKRRLRGETAAADADAAFQDAQDTRLQVRLTAELAFFEYYLSARLVSLNRENTQILEQFRATAQSKYRTNQVTQQDILQADVELAELARRQFELDRTQQVATARINTLLRRRPDAPLPSPPPELETPTEQMDANFLWQTALQQRPDLAALAWRVQSEEAALALAYKNFHPDFDVFGRYDTFWQPASTQGPLRGQVGLSVNLPIYREKLHAGVCEAQFRVNQRRAEFEQRALEIQYEVTAAVHQVEESRKTVELYSQRLLPAAEQNVAAARANYEVNKLTFLDLAISQRQLNMIRQQQQEAIVGLHRRLAELRRAVGGP